MPRQNFAILAHTTRSNPAIRAFPCLFLTKYRHNRLRYPRKTNAGMHIAYDKGTGLGVGYPAGPRRALLSTMRNSLMAGAMHRRRGAYTVAGRGQRRIILLMYATRGVGARATYSLSAGCDSAPVGVAIVV